MQIYTYFKSTKIISRMAHLRAWLSLPVLRYMGEYDDTGKGHAKSNFQKPLQTAKLISSERVSLMFLSKNLCSCVLVFIWSHFFVITNGQACQQYIAIILQLCCDDNILLLQTSAIINYCNILFLHQ